MNRTFGHALDRMRARVDSGRLPTAVIGIADASRPDVGVEWDQLLNAVVAAR